MNNQWKLRNYNNLSTPQKVKFNEFGDKQNIAVLQMYTYPTTGIDHNRALWQIIKDNKIETSTTLELVQNMRETLYNLNLEKGSASDKFIAKSLDNYIDNIYDDDTSKMFNKLRMLDFNPMYDVLEDYFLYVEELTSVEEIENYTMGYMDIIEKSSLNEMKKSFLKRSLSIVPESYKFWIMITDLSEME